MQFAVHAAQGRQTPEHTSFTISEKRIFLEQNSQRKQRSQGPYLGLYTTAKNKPMLSTREAIKVLPSLFFFIFMKFFRTVSAFSKMESQKELSGNCNKIIKAGFQLGSMFPSMASYYFLGPPYSTAFNHERDKH